LTYFKYLIYGLIQGLTEFLPISSTAHLKVLSGLLGLEDPGSSLSAILQLGSVLAILFYFRNDIFNYIKFNSKNFNKSLIESKLINSIFIGTISILILGGFVKIFIPNFSNSILRSNLSIAVISILMAILMLIADKSRTNKITLSSHNLLDAIKIGIGQAFAIIPGVSRSGITISIALLLGWNKKDATKFSFLLGIPAISIAGIVEFLDSLRNGINISFGPLLVGFITTFLISFICIDFLISYIPLKGLKIFAYYRIFFAIVVIAGFL
tara:strand:- start:257 stop:1060 length:804 start_codon:yes stop_codon:yes gene_type:complete